MNRRDVWDEFHEHKKSTATIARELRLRKLSGRESDVDRCISQCMDALFKKKPMPWSGVA